MDPLLPTIHAPHELKKFSLKQLKQVAAEIREQLCQVAATGNAHFASNLGAVELALALHTTFDFRRDRLIWDTGHQIYPHKLITGRYEQFHSIRHKGGLMGYPNPHESPYDLFMTGHAGCSISTALGLKCGDDLVNPQDGRHAVAVIGDGAFSSGIVFEAMNNTGGLKQKLTVVLNDNKMSICPRVGILGDYLDRLRMTHFYTGLKVEIQELLGKVPVIGDPVERMLAQFKDAIKAGVLGGRLFDELGFNYLGPVDGHDIGQLRKYLAMARDYKTAVLVHVVTEKGHGFQPAAEDPTRFHAPGPFTHQNGTVVSLKKSSTRSYTGVMRDCVLAHMKAQPQVVILTAAMCQGNMLEPIRDQFPQRFFDVGICESHAVAFAAGMAKAGARPIVDIYSTFLQRSYDQIFQEVALQNLPVTLCLDRAGLTGADGPTHHGAFDLAYLRVLPNLVLMAPGDELDVAPMLAMALEFDGPVAIRYPKARAEIIPRTVAPLRLGVAELLRPGVNGMIVVCGTLAATALAAAVQLGKEGLDVGVINARFIKPLDTKMILAAVRECGFVVTVEEGALMGGFGSAVLEAACDAGLDTSRIRRLGIPDRFIEHGDREELLAELNLDVRGIVRACRQFTTRVRDPEITLIKAR
jgi:1-deoxy-D-xylulose-5-phosphate synthase